MCYSFVKRKFEEELERAKADNFVDEEKDQVGLAFLGCFVFFILVSSLIVAVLYLVCLKGFEGMRRSQNVFWIQGRTSYITFRFEGRQVFVFRVIGLLGLLNRFDVLLEDILIFILFYFWKLDMIVDVFIQIVVVRFSQIIYLSGKLRYRLFKLYGYIFCFQEKVLQVKISSFQNINYFGFYKRISFNQIF